MQFMTQTIHNIIGVGLIINLIWCIKIPLKWTAIRFLKMELIPQNWMHIDKSKFLKNRKNS